MEIKALKGLIASNTFVVTKSDTTIVVEASVNVDKVLDCLNGKKPSAIFLTHEHYDHIKSIAEYANVFDCPIFCHPALLNDLKNQDTKRILKQIEFPTKFDNFVALSDNEQTKIGDFLVETHFCLGHSDASVVFLIDKTHLFSGDVLFSNSVGRMDFVDGGQQLMLKTLKKLADFKFDYAFHGHGEESNFNQQILNIKNHINWLGGKADQ